MNKLALVVVLILATVFYVRMLRDREEYAQLPPVFKMFLTLFYLAAVSIVLAYLLLH